MAEDGGAKDFHVVAIGASAGGLDSLERLFTHLPTDTGMAFIVLQHLSPDFKSLMDELLGRRTHMPIRQAEHEMAVEPNTVYLLPPVKEMIIRQQRLLLSDKDPRHGLTLPIDLFFRSLAHDRGDKAVAVVLSGSGSDGSRGILEVSRLGGMVFCESPDTAQFNGMPLSAIRTGTVDHVLPPEEIALAVAALGRPPAPAGSSGDGAESSEERGVQAILQLLRDEYAIDFSHYKASTVTRRIERRLALNRSLDVEMYLAQLRSDPRELSSLYEDLLIGVTRFFRDEESYEALEYRVIPEIVERTSPDEQIRVWVAGCATGEEPYSIAMLLHERLAERRRPVNVKILATDVHKASLEVASAGVYSEAQVAGISPDRLTRFFTLTPHGYQISQTVRDSIVFAPHNLIRDAPFTKLDLVSCRNLLIYFQPHAQKTVLTLFHFSLKPGGFLFLGSSESPGGLLDELDTIDEHSKIYRKRRDINLPRDFKLPLPRSGALARAHAFVPSPPRPAVAAQTLAVYDRLLDRFMPPSFLVDGDGQLVDTFGGVEVLLKIRARRPSQLLTDLVTGDLRAVVSGLLHRVRRDAESVRYPAVQIPGHAKPFALVAEPMRDSHGIVTHILVSFADAEAGTVPVVPPFTDVPPPSVERTLDPSTDGDLFAAPLTFDQVRALEEELAYTKEHLQAAVQEHETANEELQATNEELIASNEELQSTNEELHSVNEELYTVNAEYQKKNAELQEANDDIDHLLTGTDVATMFLDRQLSIRKFTPRIAEIFRVLPQDVGRPLRTFMHDLSYPTLFEDIERVLRGEPAIEAQTWDKRQRCFFMRILPYRARMKAIKDAIDVARDQPPPDGIVLTFIDISPLEQARARLAQLSAIVESSDDAIIGMTLDGIITSWNAGATKLYGYGANEAIGRHASFLDAPGHKDDVDTVLVDIREGRVAERPEIMRVRRDGTPIHVSVTFSPILDGASGDPGSLSRNTIVGVSAISRDITQLVRARQEVADREERIRLLLDSTAEAIYGIDLTGTCTFCNAACARLLGYESPAALIGKQMHPLIHHTRANGQPYPREQSPIFDAMRHRREAHVDGEVLWREDGTSFPAEYWAHPIVRDAERVESNEVIGAVVTFLDVSERRKAEEQILDGVRRREQFLAMLSHELRNPLAAILSATRLLESEQNGPERVRGAAAPGVVNEASRVVERQARHMARLLDDLLDVSRITHGRIVLRTEVLDVRETTRSAIESLGPVMAERDTHLTVDLPDEPVYIAGDPARLQQIQANLLSNASKYSPRGADVHLQMTTDGADVTICVSDNGRGIPADMLPRIFDLFVQGDQTLDRSEGGLGIGLTLLRSLVELHHGTVEAHSDGTGKGSTFIVRLPLATGAVSRDGRRSYGPVKSVVLVEDQADARRMMQLLLESYGITVFTAENGADGADLIERVHPDLALVDLGLPVTSGYELARQLRQRGDPTRLVALSGYGQDSDIQAALEAGFDEHLTKPPDLARLDALLRPSQESIAADAALNLRDSEL